MINNTLDINTSLTPTFSLEYNLKNGLLNIITHNINPAVIEYVTDNCIVYLLGSPIINNNINCNNFIKLVARNRGLDKNLLRKINGEFLVIFVDKNKKTLSIANDRFSSFPIYYYKLNGRVVISFSYLDILKLASHEKEFRINGESIFEYLWFRRVYHQRTYDSLTKCLLPARILKFSKDNFNEEVYWMPNFNKNNNTLKENSHELANKLSNSLERKLSDSGNRNVGLFLSGGMDTRAILSTFKKNNSLKGLQCFTVGYSKLGEYSVAKELTKNIDVTHHFVNLPNDYYDLFWDEKLQISGGMYNQYSIIFAGYSEKISKHADLLFHGHGLDYMFQGMYLPTKPIRIFNKPTYYKRVDDIRNIDSFSKYFTYNSPYRAWRIDMEKYILPKYKDNILEGIFSHIEVVENEGKSVCNDNYDLWEYMLIHNISRHYSQTDVIGISTNGEQRKIANDNELFDFYTSLPLDHRLYAKVMRGALRELSPEFSNIISANTRYRIDSGPTALTSHFAINKILKAVTKNEKYSHPSARDRTWPDVDSEVRIRKNLYERVTKLHKSEYLRETLPFFDFDRLKKDTEYWVNKGNSGGGLFLTSILTIDNMLRDIN
jgi:asparagine synthetase B (glutamine-hydrolysing)